jgi:hypothetical protein
MPKFSKYGITKQHKGYQNLKHQHEYLAALALILAAITTVSFYNEEYGKTL